MKFKQSCKSGCKFPSFFSIYNGFFAQINTKCAKNNHPSTTYLTSFNITKSKNTIFCKDTTSVRGIKM